MGAAYTGDDTTVTPSSAVAITEPVDADAQRASTYNVAFEKEADWLEWFRKLLYVGLAGDDGATPKSTVAPTTYRRVLGPYKVGTYNWRLFTSLSGPVLTSNADWDKTNTRWDSQAADDPTKPAILVAFLSGAAGGAGALVKFCYHVGANHWADGFTGDGTGTNAWICPANFKLSTGEVDITGDVYSTTGNVIATLGNLVASAGNLVATLGKLTLGATKSSATPGAGQGVAIGDQYADTTVNAWAVMISAGTTPARSANISSIAHTNGTGTYDYTLVNAPAHTFVVLASLSAGVGYVKAGRTGASTFTVETFSDFGVTHADADHQLVVIGG